MATSVLQTFLRLNLLDLDGDDSRLTKLESAAADLADSFARTPTAGVPVFLATLDAKVPAADSLAPVAAAIEKHWTTYHGAFKEDAVTLYRGVALHALHQALGLQPALAVAISLLMRNFGPVLKFGKEVEALKLVVNSADAIFDAEASAGRISKLPDAKFALQAAYKTGKFDRAVLVKRVEAAVGPNNRAGQAIEGANPAWAYTPNAPNWTNEFSDRLSALLADCLDGVVNSAHEMDSKNAQGLADFLRGLDAQSTSLRRSTSLLWWRQALYSESASVPYRRLSPAAMAVHAPIDLAALIPAPYERALESFLGEALLSIFPDAQALSAKELAAGSFGSLVETLAIAVRSEHSGLLVNAIARCARGETAAADTLLAGVSLPPQEWAVWMLREVKALDALSSPRPLAAKAQPPASPAPAPATAAGGQAKGSASE